MNNTYSSRRFSTLRARSVYGSFFTRGRHCDRRARSNNGDPPLPHSQLPTAFCHTLPTPLSTTITATTTTNNAIATGDRHHFPALLDQFSSTRSLISPLILSLSLSLSLCKVAVVGIAHLEGIEAALVAQGWQVKPCPDVTRSRNRSRSLSQVN